MRNHHQLQRRLERALQALNEMHDAGMLPPALQPLLALAPPRGATVKVELDHDAPRDASGPDQAPDQIRIAFPRQDSAPAGDDPMRALIGVVDRAERNPQLNFVALKFLRDRLLPETENTWAQSPQSCQAVIAEAIDSGVLLTSKTPNPRNPDFPVTVVQLNRENPAVTAAAEGNGQPAASDRRPEGAGAETS